MSERVVCRACAGGTAKKGTDQPQVFVCGLSERAWGSEILGQGETTPARRLDSPPCACASHASLVLSSTGHSARAEVLLFRSAITDVARRWHHAA
jgi:hypothetical protein